MSIPFKSDSIVIPSGGAADPKVVTGTANPTSGVAAPEGSIYLRYVASAGEAYVKSGTGDTDWTNLVSVSGTNLDGAYDFGGAGAGRIITADAGALQVNATTVDAQAALLVNRTPASAAAAIGVDVSMGANTNASGRGIRVSDSGQGSSIYVSKSAAGAAIFATMTSASAQALVIDISAAPTSASPVSIVANENGTTATILSLSKIPTVSTAGAGIGVSMGANTTGPAITVSAAGTGPALQVSAGAIEMANSAAAVSPANNGRLRYNSGTQTFQVSLNGAAYVDVATGAGFTLDIGDAIGSSTVGSVLFVGAGNVLQQDNANLFWDDTNNRLGIGTNAPSESLHVAGNAYISGNVTLGSDTADIHTINGRTLFAGATAGSAAVSTAEFVGGRTNAGGPTGAYHDIAFQWGGSGGGYRHFISTEHNAAGNANSLKFWLNNTSTAAGSSAPGTGNELVLHLSNDSVLNKKLIVAEAGLLMDSGTTTAYAGWANGSTAAVAAVNTGRIRYNTTGQKFQVSSNTGAYFDVATYAAALTTGSIPFANASNQLAQDNANFFWDDTNNRLGIGTAAPSASLEVLSIAATRAIFIKGNSDTTGRVIATFSANSSGVGGMVQITDGATWNWGLGGANTTNDFEIRDGTFVASAGTTRFRISKSTGEVAIPLLTQGSLLFTGASGVISQDNANLFWDDTNNRLGLGTATPGKTLDVRGDISQKSHAAFAGSDQVKSTAAVQTTDATQTTLWSVTLPDTSDTIVEARVVGRDTAGTERAVYGKVVLVYREGGGATIQGSVQDVFSDIETSAGLDATFTVSTNDVRLSVTGLSATTINWVATITYQTVSGSA